MNTGKSIKTTDDIDIRCRINSSEEHTWHTTNSQLNLVVNLIFNLLISWGKRQDILDQKFANLFQEYKKLVERCSGLNSKLDLAFHEIEEAKLRQNTICKNNDYIK